MDAPGKEKLIEWASALVPPTLFLWSVAQASEILAAFGEIMSSNSRDPLIYPLHTGQYQHKCPLCQTTVWSSQRAGRIQVKHRTPAGWPCAQHSWKAR